MKIKLLDEVLKNDDLDISKEYEVIRTLSEEDDLYFVVINEKGKEVGVHEMVSSPVT